MKAVSLVILCTVFLFPLYFMVVGSFTPMVGIMRMPPRVIPLTPTLENYAMYVSYGAEMLKWMANSIIITVVTLTLSILSGGAAAYSLAVYNVKALRFVYLAFAATMMISRYSTMIPMFVLVRTYHLVGLTSVIATGIFDSLGFFLMYDFMKRIPRDFVESARIDGAGEVRILLRIMFPLCKPVIGVVMAFQSIAIMSDFMWQRLLLQDEAQMTWVVGIMSRTYAIYIRQYYVHNYGVEMSSGILIFLPMLIIFLISNRSFIGGITLGGIKE